MRTHMLRRGILAAATAAVAVSAAPAPAPAATAAASGPEGVVACVRDEIVRNDPSMPNHMLFGSAACVTEYARYLTHPDHVLWFNRCLRRATASGIEYAMAYVPECVDDFINSGYWEP